jgi:hypothetical protein
MSTNHTNPVSPRTITDLAAGLTDPALEAIAPVLSGRDTVQLELCLWKALTGELERGPRGDVRQVVQRAALRVVGSLAPDRDDLEAVIRPAVAALRLPDWPAGRIH